MATTSGDVKGSRYKAGAALAGTIIVLSSGLALASGTGSPTPSATPIAAPLAANSNATRSFRQLEQAPSASLQDSAVKRLRNEAFSAGETAADFRTHALDRGSARITVGVGKRVLCLASVRDEGAMSQGCSLIDAAADPATPLLSTSLLSGGRYGVSGVLSDGIDQVSVTDTRGEVIVFPVEANVFSGELSHEPARVSWTGPDGSPHAQAVHG